MGGNGAHPDGKLSQRLLRHRGSSEAGPVLGGGRAVCLVKGETWWERQCFMEKERTIPTWSSRWQAVLAFLWGEAVG